MKSARHDLQLNLPPAPLQSSERTAFRRAEQERCEEERRLAEQVTAELLDRAFTGARLDNKQAAYDLDVSVSLIEKWRSIEQRGSPSFVQVWMLGVLHPVFAHELNSAINKRCAATLGQQAFANILANLGALMAAASSR
jgi:hypothetical protein